MSRVLAAALARLSESDGTLAATAFTPAQRRALNEFAQKTNAVRVKTVGRGSAYQVVDANMLAGHLHSLRPMHANDMEPGLPNRAANIAGTRNSKGAGHGHDLHYLLVKAISDGVSWEIQRGDDLRVLDLSAATEIAGAGVLAVNDDDGWRSEQPLWLVENQALFDRLDWMPADATGTVAYYAGQLPARLLKWIAARQRAPQVILFPDYDGVGLLNYARLREVSPGPCSFWLMPDWQARLRTFGSQQIWKNTQFDFQSALTRLQAIGIEAELAELCRLLSVEGLALEHESVWLSIPKDGNGTEIQRLDSAGGLFDAPDAQSAVPQEFIEALPMADYRVDVDPPFMLKIGKANEALLEMYRHHRCDCATFVTACDPKGKEFPDKANDERQAQLAKDLGSRSLVFFRGTTVDRSGQRPDDAGFLVLGMSLEAAKTLGRKYRQNDIVWCGADAVGDLVFLR